MLDEQNANAAAGSLVRLATDRALAARIEHLGAESERAFAEIYARLFPEFGASAIEIAGGVAGFLEAGSPVNGAVGMGFSGSVGQGELEVLTRFFAEHGEQTLVSICPFADPSLTGVLEEGGWTASAFENVLVRGLRPTERFVPPSEEVQIRIAVTPEERELWAALVANGFSAPDDPSPAELRLASAAASSESATLLTAFIDGRPAGTGELQIDDGIGWLTADTTMPEFRRRGVQAALQRARVEFARDAGCELALTEALPGSASQRNMERLGFHVAYTRVEALAPQRPAERTEDR